MPFTPFHFGPGAVIKAVAPRHFSFTVFAFTNVAIDVEPLYFMLANDWPIHRFFHTYAGATIAAVACYFAGRPVCSWVIRVWNSRLNEAQSRWLAVEPRIAPLPAAIGAATGAWSHVLLDSLMHSDMEPLAPFSAGGGMIHLVTIAQLELFCALAGALGVAVLLAIAAVRRK
jgi:hypothetical protein